MDEYRYDIFISYASDDRIWVEDRILKPLQRCRKADGSMPRIFFDRDRQGLELGEAWSTGLAEGVRDSRKFVPIYSMSYFEKRPCKWELTNANALDMDRSARRINAVLLDRSAQQKIPTEVSSAQFIAVDTPDWFDRLCEALGLQISTEVLTLRFKTQIPQTIVVNNTLPPVEVEIISDRGGRGRDVEVTLAAKKCELRGSLSVFSRHGLAVFDDLSLVTSSDKDVSLFATGDGCVSQSSNAFRVIRPEPAAAQVGTQLNEPGEPMFFATGGELIGCTPERLRVWSAQGLPTGDEVRVSAPIRVFARHDVAMAIGDWAGGVRVITNRGETFEWNCRRHDEGLAVPGAIALVGTTVWVGYWSGDVYRLQPRLDPDLILHHAAGVQRLAVQGDQLAFVDLAGRLFISKAGDSHGVDTGEPCIHSLAVFGDSLILVGERHMLKFQLHSRTLLKEPLRLSDVRCVLADVDSPIVCDVQGRGFRFDAGLTPGRRFQVPAGAYPVSADHAGEWAVFREPDGTHLVLRGHQVVYTHSGSLAVSPDGRSFAVREAGRLRVLDRVAFDRLIGARPSA